jgi:transcriptional regulator with XRE-family HTH domain
MATTEPGISTPASSSDVGRQLRAVRKAKGLSRAEVARSAGLTRRELAAYERGRTPVPESDLWCLAGSCGVDVRELLPSLDRLTVGSDLGALTVGESVARLRQGAGDDGVVLREYLAMVYELRNLPPGAKPPMREEDLATLAEALGGSPEAIEARLHELIGASREEAARLRSMILPPRSIGAAPADAPPTGFAAPFAVPATVSAAPAFPEPPASSEPPVFAEVAAFPGPDACASAEAVLAPPRDLPPPVGPAAHPVGPAFPDPVTSAPDPALPTYPPPTFDFAAPAPSIGDPDAADRFFSAPRADDPFAPPPPLESLAPPVGAFPPPHAVDAFAVPGAPTLDPFGPPVGTPFAADAAAPAAVDPFGLPMPAAPTRPDGFVADLGTDLPDFTLPAFTPPPPADRFGAAEPATVDVPPGSTEMVVLDVGPDGSVVEAPPPTPVVDEAPLATGDDPFAVLRVPIDDAMPEGSLDPGVASLWSETADPGTELPGALDATDATAHSGVDVDVFATAFDLPPADTIGVAPAFDAVGPTALPSGTVSPADAALDVDDPTDDWFDRAAAAADALIAGQRTDPLDVVDVVDVVDTVGAVGVVDPTDAIDHATVVDTTGDGTRELDPDVDCERAEPGAIDPELPPIAWSLAAPADAPSALAEEPPAPASSDPTEEFVAAGPDWQVGGIFPATAMADDGTLALRRADVRWALADVAATGDFTARASVNFTSGAGFGILFRVSTDESERITGYSFDIDPIYSGGGFLLRQWNDSRQHWKPLAHTPATDTARLYGAHVIEVSLRHDVLVASIDGETVMEVPQLSRRSVDAGHAPCRGDRIGVQAWSTTEVTVDRLLVARH